MNSSLKVATELTLGSSFVPLFGESNIWVDAVDALSPAVIQSLVQSALEGTSSGELEILVFDEGLSGLTAPFWALNSAGDKVLKIIGDDQDLKATLAFLRQHIQGVKNVMKGEVNNLVEFRKTVGFPVEGYKLVVLSADFSTLSEDIRLQLEVLFRAGPAAGVSFIVHSVTDDVNEFLLERFSLLSLWKGSLEWKGHGSIVGWASPTAESLIDACQRFSTAIAATRVDPVAFGDIQQTQTLWPGSSRDGLTFSIGRYGREIVSLTVGDELNQRHNMLVTGAVGQGKSNLISVIIHSLCQQYSPTELELYLLDFKEGVTLQPFTGGTTGHYLPHATVLGLEADREFGLSVFKHLHQIYRERMKTFKEVGVQSISKYRIAHPSVVMPRIVLVIDEFQMMFAERDRVSDEIANLLVKGVRLFRACGIHVILASQTIGGNVALMGSAGEGLFGQVPIRVALKNSLTESHATLSVKNDAATHLRVGQAIVNEDYGEPQSNRKTSIALAEPSDLAFMREHWWNNRPQECAPPNVFEGSVKRSVTVDRTSLIHARSAGILRLFLGTRIDVEGRPLDVGFSQDISRNAVILGAGDVLQQIQNMALSLTLQTPCQFVLLDLLDTDPQWAASSADFVNLLQQAGSSVSSVPKDKVGDFIIHVTDSLAARTATSPPMILLGLGMDRARVLPMEFQDLVKTGPAVGVHMIGWWRKLESFREHVGYGGDSYFDIRLALKLDPVSTKQFMTDPLLEWKPADNRMIAWDAAELPEPVATIPYGILDSDTVRTITGLT